jgi:hypothetical protein
MSGGNDGRIVLWKWQLAMPDGSGASATSADESPVVLNVVHGRKVNWLCSSRQGAPLDVFVADVSSVVSVYQVRA